MITNIIFLEKTNNKRYSSYLNIRVLFLTLLCFSAFQINLQAQDVKFTKSPWWIGAAGGLNYNLYHGSAQFINPDLSLSATFQNRKGQGFFAFPLIEFHRPDRYWGFMFYAGYESRQGSFDDLFSTKLAYITIEPSIRLNLFNSPLYFYSGPRFAFNSDKRFTYKPGNELPETGGVFSDMKKSVVSMQIGLGYDLPLTSKTNNSQVILAPFVAFHPYFGQNPRTIESWNITTIRAGIAFKFGRGIKTVLPEKIYTPIVILPETNTSDIITEPKEIEPREFIAGNEVYFQLRSSGINDPFSKSGKQEMKNFNPTPEEILNPEKLSDQTFRKTFQEDNFLNFLGQQMAQDSMSGITLIGSSKSTIHGGLQLAESIKMFLTGVHDIDASRIEVKDRRRLKIHKKQSGNKYELGVIRQSDRQVLVRSKSKSLAMKFSGSPDNQVSSMKIYDVPDVNKGGFLDITTKGFENGFNSWTILITDDQGQMKEFGPYSKDFIRIPKKYLLGEKPAGKFQISLIGQSENGQIMRRDTSVYLAAWPVFITDKVMRYSVQYEFNNLKSIGLYRNYLQDIITPNIPKEAKVVIHGHSEKNSNDNYDLIAFLTRENDAREIIERALAKANRKDVEIQVLDFNKDETFAPFTNKTSEITSYSRTIIIDIIKP